MAAIDKLTVVSTDGAGALPRQVADNLTQIMALLKTTTGVDVETLIQRYAANAPVARGGASAVAPAPASAAISPDQG